MDEVSQCTHCHCMTHTVDGLCGKCGGRKGNYITALDSIEFRRDQMGWTKSRMAAELGLAKSHYSELMHGKRQLSLRVARKAYQLGVPADVLLTERYYVDYSE